MLVNKRILKWQPFWNKVYGSLVELNRSLNRHFFQLDSSIPEANVMYQTGEIVLNRVPNRKIS